MTHLKIELHGADIMSSEAVFIPLMPRIYRELFSH